ncbi:MAG: carboxypeptidase regulatory-like domain-containing protein [Dokdonella sp.]
MRIFALALLITSGLALADVAAAAALQGHVGLVVDGKPLRAEEAADVVIYFRPSAAATVRAPNVPYAMSTQRKQFVPRILPIVVGSKVRFPNQDPILHNAFSASKDNAFDVGLYSGGEEQTVTFAHPGYVRVYCNVHHSMVGHILVLDTPYFTRPDADGRFKFTNLPKGRGDLVVWHDRATPWHAQVVPGESGEIDVTLDLDQRRIPPHMNKFGKPYGRSSNGEY